MSEDVRAWDKRGTRDTAQRIAWLKIEPCPDCRRTNQVCAIPPGAVRDDPCPTCGHGPKCHAWRPVTPGER